MPKFVAVCAVAAALAALTACGGRQAAPKTTSITVFRLHGGLLHAERAEVPTEPSTPAAALDALGLHLPLTVESGNARIGAEKLAPGRVAEVVYTLTRFSAVHSVDIAGRHGLTRADVARFVPIILVESPADGQRVPADFVVSGTASVFEATLVVELRHGSDVLVRRTVTASEGAPGRGTFATMLHAPSAGAATVVAYAPSAADGTPQHVQRIPVTVS